MHRDEAANLSERQRLAAQEGGVPFLGKLRLDRCSAVPFKWRVDPAECDPNVMDMRLWASNRGQTLARTVRGVMKYEEALRMLCSDELLHTVDSAYDDPAKRREQAATIVGHKCCFVVTAQIFGAFDEMYKKKVDPKSAEDREKVDRDGHAAKREAVCYLMKCYPSMRVAYMDKRDGVTYSVLLHGLDEHDNPLEVQPVLGRPCTPGAGASTPRLIALRGRLSHAGHALSANGAHAARANG